MKSLINFICSPFKILHCPLYNMIFEYAFVELVQEVWGEAREDVAVGKILPEWMVQL
jgi:hypothetical protein